MKREHTEEEILELGRKALAKHKITVYVLQYTHKHGETISVYGGRKSAENAADDLITNRVSESWSRFDRHEIGLIEDFTARLDYFHSIEVNVSYGEIIKIHECVVG
jgi:hypothetical protein